MSKISKIAIPGVAEPYDIGTLSIPFGQVDSTSTDTAYTAQIEGITSLYDGVCVYLKNGVITSNKNGFTLNINSLGAKPVYDTLAAATRSGTVFNVDYTMLFVYNSSRVSGGCWDIFYGYNSDTTDLEEALTPLTGTTETLTPTQVYNAIKSGKSVVLQYTDSTYGLISFTAFTVSESLNVIASSMIAYYNGVYILCELVGYKSTDRWGFMTTTLAQKTDIPEALPNPNALTFTGAVEGSYDGSEPVTVEIPSGGSGGTEETIADVQLASGTIPAETASLTSIDTGVTLEMLKQYKRFAFKFKGASNVGLQNVYLRFAANSGAIARTDNVSGVAISYEWINTTASLLRICAQFSGNQSLISAIGTGYVFKTVPVSHGNGLCGTGMLGVLDLSTIAASSTLKIFLTYKATIDYNWELRGITA